MTEVLRLPEYFKPYKFDDLIRIGSPNDGGYIVRKKDIYEAENLLSFGLSFNYSFEKEFYTLNKKVKIHTFDGSVGFKYFLKSCKTRIKNYFKNPSNENLKRAINRFHEFLNFVLFFRLNLSKKIRHTEKFVTSNLSTFKDFKQSYGYEPKGISIKTINLTQYSSLFLSIDIEGGEYDLLDDLVKLSNNLLALNIEFHDVDKNLESISTFIQSCNLILIHTHVNNFGQIKNGFPTVVELSFSRYENNFDNNCYNNKLPIELDQKNDKYGKDFIIKFD